MELTKACSFKDLEINEMEKTNGGKMIISPNIYRIFLPKYLPFYKLYRIWC